MMKSHSIPLCTQSTHPPIVQCVHASYTAARESPRSCQGYQIGCHSIIVLCVRATLIFHEAPAMWVHWERSHKVVVMRKGGRTIRRSCWGLQHSERGGHMHITSITGYCSDWFILLLATVTNPLEHIICKLKYTNEKQIIGRIGMVCGFSHLLCILDCILRASRKLAKFCCLQWEPRHPKVYRTEKEITIQVNSLGLLDLVLQEESYSLEQNSLEVNRT